MIHDLVRRRWHLAAAIALLLLVLVIAPDPTLAKVQPAAPQLQPQAIVTINYPNGNFTYSPADVRIAVGDEVEWQGSGLSGDFASHPLVSDEGLWTTPTTGTVFTFKFTKAGLYHFHCFFHGSIGMKGTVLVVGDKRTYLPLTVLPASPAA